MPSTDLSTFNNSDYRPGNPVVIALWYWCNLLFVRGRIIPFSFTRRVILRLFGAKIGKGVVIKPGVNIKYPWKLTVGDYSWIGEGVWLDNLGHVSIGSHCCISQGALLLCGNHNYKSPSFDLIVGDITLEDGAWIGAKATVCGGTTVASHAVLSVGSVTSNDLKEYTVYAGNPAKEHRKREMVTR